MSFIRMIALALALASTTAWNSHPSKSARDQYEAREDRPLSHLLNEATDYRLGVRQSDFKQPQSVDKTRQKRSFTPWSGQMIYRVEYPSINLWKPPIFALSRPYIIPIYGVEGKPPIYYPPQALDSRPQIIKKPFAGPSYLPPVEPTMSTSTIMPIDNRFNEDGPVWDAVPGSATTTTTSVPPTRRRRPPNAAPPLVHKPTDPKDRDGAERVEEPSTTTASTPVVAAQQQRPAGPNEPSRCVWAIISCCTSGNEISYSCFEQRGCPGAFWDTNPCDSEFAQAAISAALNYYNK